MALPARDVEPLPLRPDRRERTEPVDSRVRKVALGHALLSYAFGTGVLAVAINLVTNLVTNLGQ